LSDNDLCGTFTTHTVTIVGYSTINEPIPYWIVKNSWGTSWGEQGYAKIAITDGLGVCGINQEVSYPNIILMPGPILFGSVIACMTFGLFVIFPISWVEYKDSLKRDHHPAQKPFRKTLIFEGVAFLLCWVLYMMSLFSSFTQYQFRQLVVYCFYTAIHLTYLSLHNCLAMKSLTQQQLKYEHRGIPRYPYYLFSALFLTVMGGLIIVVITSKIQYSLGENTLIFDLIHVSTLDIVLQTLLYGTCALVQAVAIRNLYAESEKKHIRFSALFGFTMGVVSFFLIISDIICVIYYPGKQVEEVSAALSLIWSSMIMLPITHYLVIRHQKYKPSEAEIRMIEQWNRY
jgi:hypothetical protein